MPFTNLSMVGTFNSFEKIRSITSNEAISSDYY